MKTRDDIALEPLDPVELRITAPPPGTLPKTLPHSTLEKESLGMGLGLALRLSSWMGMRSFVSWHFATGLVLG